MLNNKRVHTRARLAGVLGGVCSLVMASATLAQPANDACSSAQVIAPFGGTSTSVTGNNSAATSEVGASVPTACALSSPGYKDVYFAYTPGAGQGGPTSFSLCGSTPAFDTVLSVHTGCPATAANTVAGGCNDDGCTGGAGLSSLSNLNLTAGTTYIIRVANYSSSATVGAAFTLNVSRELSGACCTGATCAIQTQSACATAGGTFTSGAACATGFCTNGACCNTTTGACTITSSTSCTGTFLGLQTVCGPTNPCGVACCNATTGVCSVALSGSCPSGTVQLGTQSCTVPSNPCPQPPPPANDNCPGTALVSGVTVTGSTAAATGTAIAAACTGTSRDVYYSFTNTGGASSFEVSVTPTGTTGVGTVVSTVCPAASAGDILACQAQTTATFITNVSVNAAQTIYIRVADFGETTPAVFTLRVGTPTPPPANDTCAGAQPLIANVPAVGTNAFATGDNTEGPAPSCQANFGKSVWFSFTAPTSDVFGFTACGSTFDTVLTVFDGTCGSFGNQIGCDDDSCDGVTPPGSGTASVIAPVALTQGQTYLIRLSGYNNTTGSYTLTVTGNVLPPQGVCCRGEVCSTGLSAAQCQPVSSNGTTIPASFVLAASSCNAPGNNQQPCCYGNFDRSADGVQVADIFAFLSAFFANSPYAIQQTTTGGAEPTGTPGVPDIFNFLSAFFGAGGCV